MVKKKTSYEGRVNILLFQPTRVRWNDRRFAAGDKKSLFNTQANFPIIPSPIWSFQSNLSCLCRFFQINFVSQIWKRQPLKQVKPSPANSSWFWTNESIYRSMKFKIQKPVPHNSANRSHRELSRLAQYFLVLPLVVPAGFFSLHRYSDVTGSFWSLLSCRWSRWSASFQYI